MKKRISSLILAFSILLSIVPLGVLTTFAQDTILYGDADGNGKVDMSDVNLMERYIDGDAEAINGIRFTEADVNVDEVVDEVDLALVKEYLAGNIQLTDDLCTVSFDTNGGEALEPIRVGRNYAIMQEIPSPGKEGEIFIGWKTADGADFYQTEPVTGDMTLYAQYVPVESAEQVYIDSFALTDQRPIWKSASPLRTKRPIRLSRPLPCWPRTVRIRWISSLLTMAAVLPFVRTAASARAAPMS